MNENLLKKILIGSLGVVILLWLGVGGYYYLVVKKTDTGIKKETVGEEAIGKKAKNSVKTADIWEKLKTQAEAWQELKEKQCLLYDYEQPSLTFYCADDLVRKYTYNSDFIFSKNSEESWGKGIFEGAWKKERSDCVLKETKEVVIESEKYKELTINCGEEQLKVYFHLTKLYFTLPVVIDKNLTQRERVRASGKLLEGEICHYDFQQEIATEWSLVALFCGEGKSLPANYDLKNNWGSLLIEKENAVLAWPIVKKWQYPLLKTEEIKAVGEGEYQLTNGQGVISRLKEGQPTGEIYLKTEEIK